MSEDCSMNCDTPCTQHDVLPGVIARLCSDLTAARQDCLSWAHKCDKLESSLVAAGLREKEWRDLLKEAAARHEKLMTVIPVTGDILLLQRFSAALSTPASVYEQRARKMEKVCEKVGETMAHYEKELAGAKARHDKRVYELTEVAYLAVLREDLKALSDLRDGCKS